MAKGNTQAVKGENQLPVSDPLSLGPGGNSDLSISAEHFQENFGEDIRQTLDLNTWRVGSDLNQEYSRIEREVREAVERENVLQKKIRDRVFPCLIQRPNAPKNAGKHEAKLDAIEAIHGGLLFNGGIEACDGAIQIHDTLPLTIYQIGVSLVSYRGDQGTWCQRLFRRDLRQQGSDPVDEAIQILERRARRSALPTANDMFGELVQKAILDYSERAILLRRSQATWRMGHGNPVTYELMTGGGNLELMVEATRVLRELIEGHQKFVFVGREPRDRMLLTIGEALRPLEFAIVSTLDERLEDWIHQRRFAVDVSTELSWDHEFLTAAEWIPRFIKRVASQVVVGLFRATRLAPAQVFYAHADHADLAGHIALADSVLQEHKGFPLLADMANHLCDSIFGNSLDGLAETAYAAAGVPWRYFSRRSNRNR
jgi:hypothetical protein